MTDALGAPDLPAMLEHRAWVRALARRLCADENDVDDVEQETWTVAMRRRPDEPRALRSWLGVVASRLALQRRRSESRRARREEAAADPESGERSTADVVATADAHGHVVQAVLALDEPYRTTVLLRYFEGLEIAAVARRMDAPAETVRTRLKRAHERLRATLAPDDDRALLLLLAPAVRTAVATASLAHSAAVVAGVVALGAGGAWLLTTTPDRDVASATANASALFAAAARPEPAPQEKPPAPVAANDPWIAYDLADGSPIAGLHLIIVTRGGGATRTTDDAGRVDIERAKVKDLGPEVGSEWHFARPKDGAVKDEPSLWFWRERPVRLLVWYTENNVASPDAGKSVVRRPARVTWFLPSSSAPPDEPVRGKRWRTQHGLDPQAQELTFRQGARGLLGTVRAVRGAVLVVEADGCAPEATTRIWKRNGEDTMSVDMRPALAISGRLLDENGDTVAGATVQLDTSILTTTDEDVALATALRPRGGWTFAGKLSQGVVTLTAQSTTDAQGGFRLDATPYRMNVVTVLRPGHLVCRREFGETVKDAPAFNLRLVRSDARTLVRDAGAPSVVTTFDIQVADHRESAFLVETDDEGRADFGWLQRGRWYRVSRRSDVTPGRSGCLLWDGQPEVDLARLPKEPAGK